MFKRLFVTAFIAAGCSGFSLGQIANCDFVGNVGCNIDDLNAIYEGVDGAPGLNARSISDWLLDASAVDNPLKANPADVYLAGDVNLDGNVDSVDLGVVLNNFQEVSDDLNWSDGNLNPGNSVNSADLGILLNNFGASSTTAVPEPASAHLALLLIASLIPFFRKQTR